ncbi:hypothetical protein HK104_000105 [Borealophlyctis nickersoniae]|nr:hypothetical protein HK104_000105 [Borealophlyctis nickersoniae]
MKSKANLTNEEIRKVETVFPELEKMEEDMDILIRGMLRKEPSKDMMQRFDDFLSATSVLTALANSGRKMIHLENMSVDAKLEYLEGIIESLAQLAFLDVPTSDIPVAVQFPHAVGRLSQDQLDDFAFNLCMGKMMVYDLLTNNTHWRPQGQCEHCIHEYDEYEPPEVNYCQYHLIKELYNDNYGVRQMEWGTADERDIESA